MRKTVLGLLAAVIVAATAAPSFAQIEQPSQITIQATGLVTKDSNDQIPSNNVRSTAGLLVGYSYQFTKWIGVEGNYGYTRDYQNYGTSTGASSLQTDFHEATGALVVHFPVHVRGVNPYALAGGGALVFRPTQQAQAAFTGAQIQTRGAFVYGGGVDFNITNHYGLRAEYRGLVDQVPDFTVGSLTTNKWTNISQPSVGFFFRF